MAKTAQYFDRWGRKLAEEDALQDNVLRDGVVVRVPLHMADAARFAEARPLRITDARSDARAYWDAERDALLVTDGRGDDPGLNRPGFRSLFLPRSHLIHLRQRRSENWPLGYRSSARLAGLDPTPASAPTRRSNDDHRSTDNSPVVDMASVYKEHRHYLENAWRRT
jgi:hypothetical protein